MKSFLRSMVASSLAVFARIVIAKYKPIIVMVTGSVGKTSTKDAVAAALSNRYYVRASEKSYNSEFGVPLTVLGAKNPWENPAAWIRVFQEALALMLLPNHYPKLLVLEVGADRPGDLARILRVATPDAVLVTKLPDVPVHVEAYASPQAVRDEEFRPAYALGAGCPLIISSDDEHAVKMAQRLNANVVTVGFAEHSSVRIGSPMCTGTGMEALVHHCGNTYTVRAPNALGRAQLYAPAMALATATLLHMTADEALEGLAAYTPPPGRGRMLRGIHGSILIDDSYNSSPSAVAEALRGLSLMPAKRRIAVLGDMLELGRYSVEEHQKVGRLVKEHADVLVTVGNRSQASHHAAEEVGMANNNVQGFATATQAAHALRDFVREGDVVLIKGSQSMRMERVVEVLLANPHDTQLLVRQDKEWKRR